MADQFLCSCREVKYVYETIDSGSDHYADHSVDDRICAVKKKRRSVHDLNMGSVMPTSRYDEFKRIRRSRHRHSVELWMARGVLIVFV